LFISIEEDCYRTMARLDLAHSAQREQHHDNPSLHVQHTWTVGAPPFQAKRHGCQGAQRPDGIEVPQQHDWLLICSAGEFDLKMITVIGCFVDFCPPAHPRKFFCQKFAHFVDGSFVVAGKLDFDHTLENGEHFGHALFAEGQISCCV